ncbi:DUF4325 domain-containing protein [Rhizobium sp.]|uniref:STAS-like domain-containing protein n=1 Tax=Rhizobium sp. TaxID=391 RepID=UPI002AA7CAE3
MRIEVSQDFTRYPGPRYREHGDFSGEQFREEVLKKALRSAIDANSVLVVVLDDVAGYGSSFLEEAFGGLIRHGFSKHDLDNHLQIVANTDRFKHHERRAKAYIDEAASLVMH